MSILYIFLIFLSSLFITNENTITDKMKVIPKPQKTILKKGQLNLQKLSHIQAENGHEDEIRIANLFQSYLSPLVNLPIYKKKTNTKSKIVISLNNKNIYPSIEGYTIVVGEKENINLNASSYAGLFYGFQTFRQLCDVKVESGEKKLNNNINKLEIHDYPEFQYRGMHLDVSRHFFDIDFIKTYIDMIALHKMNVFHWHLTDDNGWRIEINQYPLLTKKSAWRVDRRNETWKKHSPIKKNEKPTYGGFYTKSEIKEVIKYASERNVLVIPEIEMPGHTSEVFAAYPELSCQQKRLTVQTGSYWPNIDIFCAGNDTVFEFLENILGEIVDLFPGQYIHIGGDEADKKYWKECKKCQKRITTERLKNETELQSWFIKRIEKFLISKNKKMVGWDEIIEGGIPKKATIMSWRGPSTGIEAAKLGHDVIMCPTSHCYFDYYQADPESSPEAFGGHTTLKKVYSFNPVPEELNNNEEKRIIGAQGNLWTEYVQTPEMAQYRALPRMSALSEVLWTGPGKLSYNDFYSRLKHLQKRFEFLKWNYAPGSFAVSIDIEPIKNNQEYKIKLSSEKPGEIIRYTLNGDNPTNSSMIYKEPIKITKTTTLKAAMLIDGLRPAKITHKTIYFNKALGKKIIYLNNNNKKYPGLGPLNLINGLTGTADHNDGYWHGWEEIDMDIIVDLMKPTTINKVSIGFLEAHLSWIFLPTDIEISFSIDNNFYDNLLKINLMDGKPNGLPNRKTITSAELSIFSRYVKIKAINRKVCPEWHHGSGFKSWIFSDEIIIE